MQNTIKSHIKIKNLIEEKIASFSSLPLNKLYSLLSNEGDLKLISNYKINGGSVYSDLVEIIFCFVCLSINSKHLNDDKILKNTIETLSYLDKKLFDVEDFLISERVNKKTRNEIIDGVFDIALRKYHHISYNYTVSGNFYFDRFVLEAKINIFLNKYLV